MIGRTWLPSALVAVLAVALTGCSQESPETPVRVAEDPNFLAGCGPLDDQKLAATIGVTSLRQQSQPTICDWTAKNPGGGTVDITYAWLQNNFLSREVAIAGQYGYQIERLMLKHFAGMYLRDPNDPGSCGVTVSDTGTVTWWVHNRDHTAQPDPCAAALALTDATLSIDGV